MANKISAVIEVDTKGGIKNVDGLAKALKDAEADGKSAGQTIAAALGQMADHIETDMKETVAAADKLGAALGPDLSAKIGQNGLIDMVSDLKKLGLTSADIETDVDDLANSIKRLDTVGAGINGPQKGLKDIENQADKTKGAVKNLGNESDNSGSVMANMAGNSAQEIAAIGGASSTAGMALGQFAEYATEGNISLKGLLKVAGPMAAITVATMAMAKGSQQAAERARELTDAYSKLTEATDEQALAILPQMWMDVALSGRDAAAMFREMADANIEGARRLRDLMEAQGATEGQTRLLTEAIEAHDEAVVRGAENTEKYGDQADVAATKQDKLDAAAKNVVDTVGAGVTGAMEDATAAVEANQRANENLARSVQAEFDAIGRKYDELTGRIDDNEAWANLQLDFMALKEKGEEALTALKDGTEDARTKSLEYQIAVDQNKKSIIDYTSEVLKVPSERTTRILAAVDAGDLERAELLLANLTRNRQMSISIEAKMGAGYNASGLPRFASGGIVPGAKGEPRLVVAHGGEKIISNGQQAAGGMGTGSGLTVNVYPKGHIMTPDDVVLAVTEGIIDAQRRGVIPAGAFT